MKFQTTIPAPVGIFNPCGQLGKVARDGYGKCSSGKLWCKMVDKPNGLWIFYIEALSEDLANATLFELVGGYSTSLSRTYWTSQKDPFDY